MKNILVILFILIAQTSFPQSISLFYGYPNYFMNMKENSEYSYENNFNSIIGGTINHFIINVKIGIGSEYISKKYIKSLLIASELYKSKMCLNYYQGFFFVEPKLWSNSENIISLRFQTSFWIPISSYEKKIFPDESINWEKQKLQKDFGASVGVAVIYYKRIIENLYFFANIYFDYKYKIDCKYEYPSGHHSVPIQYDYLTNDRYSAGINIGIEWIFYDKYVSFYKKKIK